MKILSIKSKEVLLSFAVTGALVVSAISPVFNSGIVHAESNSYVTLNKFSGTPATTLTISGGNYGAREIVDISIVESGIRIATALATASEYGEFSSSLTLPTKLPQGNAVVTATGKTSGKQATNNYYVAPFTPSLKVNAGSSDPFSNLMVSGTGFAPNEAVSINFAGSVTNASVDANGALATQTLLTPNVPAASYTLVVEGKDSGASATAYQYINSFYASASPSTYYVLPATELAFNGSGFASNEIVTVTDAKTMSVVSSFKTTVDGTFKNGGGFTVPASYAGQTKEFILTGTTSKATTKTSTVVGRYFPNVSPSVYYAMPESTVGFNGSGFLPGELIDITSGTDVLATVSADKYGAIKNLGDIVLPVAAAGTNQAYTLTGRTSLGMASTTIQVGKYIPQVSPSAYYAQPGSTVTFTGSGFAPGETVMVKDGTKKLASFVTNKNGTFTAAGGVMVGYDQAGATVKLTITGSMSNQPQKIAFGVGQLQTQVSPSSYYVLPYESFSVNASGFAPNEAITLSNDGAVIATINANELGKATFNNVSLPAGITSAELVVTGKTSNAVNSVTIGLGVYTPSVSASDYYVKPGTKIQLLGGGFAAKETVSIQAGATSLNATTDEDGMLHSAITVPFGSTKATLDITSTGLKSQATTTTTITLAPFTPQVSPSTYYAAPGTPVTFTGNGFVAGELVTVSLNGTQIGTETVDTKGLLTSKSYTLPFGSTAVYTLTGSLSAATTSMSVGLAQFYAGTQLDNYYGNGGSMVTVSGSGFAANETVTITAGKTVIGNVQTDKAGSYSKLVKLPYAIPGNLAITSTGSLSGASATTTFTVATAYNSVELGSYAPAAGESVLFIGRDYFAGEPVVVTSDRMNGTYTFNAQSNGSFMDKGYVLPKSLTPGEMTLTITGTYSHTVSKITIYVTPAK